MPSEIIVHLVKHFFFGTTLVVKVDDLFLTHIPIVGKYCAIHEFFITVLFEQFQLCSLFLHLSLYYKAAMVDLPGESVEGDCQYINLLFSNSCGTPLAVFILQFLAQSFIHGSPDKNSVAVFQKQIYDALRVRTAIDTGTTYFHPLLFDIEQDAAKCVLLVKFYRSVGTRDNG